MYVLFLSDLVPGDVLAGAYALTTAAV